MQLSILLPTHERPETLALAIDSVRHQQFEDWELLVCGDGCGPATEEVVADAMRRDSRVRWFSLPKGPGFGYANRNTVLAEARGELIAFAAHDDLIFPDHWSRLTGVFRDPAVMIASSSAAFVDDSGQIVPVVYNLADPSVRDLFLNDGMNRMPASAFVYRASLHNSVGMWDPDLPKWGDRDLWARIIRHCGVESFRYLPYVGFLHFRGTWRNAAGVLDPHAKGIWKRLLSSPGRVPDTLFHPVPPGALPQDVFFGLLHGPDSAEWTTEVRKACALALESFACEAEFAWMEADGNAMALKNHLAAATQALSDTNHAAHCETLDLTQANLNRTKDKEKIAKLKTKLAERDAKIANLKQRLTAAEKPARRSLWRRLFRRKPPGQA